MTAQEIVAELRDVYGVTSNGHGPLAWVTKRGKRKTQPRSVLDGMLERQRVRAAAFAAGAVECALHPDEAQGACPRCLGLWHNPDDDTR